MPRIQQHSHYGVLSFLYFSIANVIDRGAIKHTALFLLFKAMGGIRKSVSLLFKIEMCYRLFVPS